MQRDKLEGLIKDKNDRLERETMRSAEELIEQISREQLNIANCQKRIAECRDQLKALEVRSLNASDVLGE